MTYRKEDMYIPNSFEYGDVWEDPVSGHRIACLDAANPDHVAKLMGEAQAELAIQDPPYNQVEFAELPVNEYIQWSNDWIDNTIRFLAEHASLYVWLGADQDDGFQPLPEFMIMMRDKPLKSRSFITMRNQRGYGTQKNWMAVRQELLYYVKGDPYFEVQYTDIPKKTGGYLKEVGGRTTENFERSKSSCIRPGNVWFDIQQIFYRMHENVKYCRSQKPLDAIRRIMEASSKPGDLVIDFFSHSGSTLLQAEMTDRRCYTMDNDPVYCEITAKRLAHYRQTGKTGWQNEEPELQEQTERTLFA